MEENEEEIAEIEHENEKTHWFSIGLTSLFIMISGIHMFTFASSIFQYLQEMDESVTEIFFGWTVSAVSVGQLISSPLFGYYSNKRKRVKEPILVGVLFLALSNILYCLPANLPISWRKWTILVVRFVTGIGAGNLAVLTAYIPMASLLKDRNRATTIAFGGMSFGLIFGPGVQYFFTPIGYPGLLNKYIHLNMYTLPAVFLLLLDIICFILLIVLFKESTVGLYEGRKEVTGTKKQLTKLHWGALVSILLMWCMMLAFILTDETVLPPYAMSLFAMTKEESTKYISLLYVCCGTLDLVFMTLYGLVLEKRFSERSLIAVASVGFIIYRAITYPWQFWPAVKLATSTHHSVSTNITSALNNSTSNQLGCNVDKFQWCTRVHAPSPVFIFAAFVTLSFLWAISSVPLGSLFTKVLGPRRQGVFQAIRMQCGAVSKLLAPIVTA